MTISVRELFARRGIASSAGQTGTEIISLRNSLTNHHQGLEIGKMGLREAHKRFTTLASSDGNARGCHANTITLRFNNEIPSWVPVDNHETRTVEGVLRRSNITARDMPLRPWHFYYDWNFHIDVDRQYTYLLSESNVDDHEGVFECEWDTGTSFERFLELWSGSVRWPQDGDRIWMVGRWIYDCGHEEAHGFKTEIHPPKAFASYYTEAILFAGNGGHTRANNAVVYIGRNGGYWGHPINDQDYAFDLYLPPRPYPEATPVSKVTLLRDPQGPPLPQPQITPFPAGDPRLLRVVVPLRGIAPHPEIYGAIISGGWSDPRGTESAAIQRVRVDIEKIFMDGDFDTFGDEWYVYVGVNGRWRIWKSIGGDEQALNHTVDLNLHPSDRIHITACGFEADLLHDHFGDSSGFSWETISNPNQDTRRDINFSLISQLSTVFGDLNAAIGHFSVRHLPAERGTFTNSSENKDYRLRYTITTQ